MKNITLTIDDETHRLARIRAAELGTSLSALVKDYLAGLVREDRPVFQGVREMPATFAHFPAEFAAPFVVPLEKGPEGHPYCVNGKWAGTKDGKPRKPGAMRHLGGGWTPEFDSWPDGFLDAMEGEDTSAADKWWLGANDVLKTAKSQ